MTPFKTLAQTPCLRRYFLFRYYKIQYKMGKIYLFKLFGVTYKKIFLRLLTEQNQIILKYFVTHVDLTPPEFTPC